MMDQWMSVGAESLPMDLVGEKLKFSVKEGGSRAA